LFTNADICFIIKKIRIADEKGKKIMKIDKSVLKDKQMLKDFVEKRRAKLTKKATEKKLLIDIKLKKKLSKLNKLLPEEPVLKEPANPDQPVKSGVHPKNETPVSKSNKPPVVKNVTKRNTDTNVNKPE